MNQTDVPSRAGFRLAHGFSERILVIGHQAAEVRDLIRMLRGMGYSAVDATIDPGTVRGLHRRHRYGAILLDVERPGSLDDLHGLPIIAIASQPSLMRAALHAGARDVVGKPCEPTEVLTRVSNLLELRHLHAMSRRLHLLERVVSCRETGVRGAAEGCPTYDFAASSRPVQHASGDIYELVARPDGRVVILLADATGHGLAPSLLANELRSLVRMAVRLGAPLDAVASEASDLLARDLPDDRFVTAFLGELDPVAHRLSYVAPGQGPLLHWHASTATAEWRTASGPPLGVADGPLAPGAPMQLEVGDVVVLATDGIFERACPGGSLFGEVGVEAVLRELSDAPAQAIGAALEGACDAAARGAAPSDDATLVVIKRL